MKRLYLCVKDLIGCDCHIHLFNIHDHIPTIDMGGVGFPDISMRTEPELYTREAVIDMYKKNLVWFPGYDVLATAVEPETAIEVLEKFKLPGFGELKCYPTDKQGNPLPYKSEKYWKPLFEYADQHKLPVWIHWSLLTEDDYYNLMDIIMHHPNAKFVICHCGIDTEHACEKANTSQEMCFERCLKLLERFPNTFADISWAGADFFLNNPQYTLPDGKYVIGSDITPYDYEKHPEQFEENKQKYLKLKKTFINTASMYRIF